MRIYFGAMSNEYQIQFTDEIKTRLQWSACYHDWLLPSIPKPKAQKSKDHYRDNKALEICFVNYYFSATVW